MVQFNLKVLKRILPMLPANTVPIVYITDDNYTMPTIISIISLLKNMQNPPTVYILGIDLSNKNKEYFNGLNGVKLLNLDNKYKNLDLKHRHVTKSALFKFDLAEIFNEFDKILYIDSDTVIKDDIKTLLDTDVEGVYGGVVKDIFATTKNGDNERISVTSYFNSGLMLLNLAKMREGNIKEKLLNTRLGLKSEKYMDQDVFNLVFDNCVKYLSPNFNYMLNNKNSRLGFLEFYEIKNLKPAVLHYAYLKPWEYKGIAYSREWMKYYNLSPFKDEKLNLKENPDKPALYKKEKYNDRWVIDILGLRISYKKGGKDFRLFYP